MGDDGWTGHEWLYGVALSVAASIVSGASKLLIRKSWLLEEDEATMIPLPPRKHLGTEETVVVMDDSSCSTEDEEQKQQLELDEEDVLSFIEGHPEDRVGRTAPHDVLRPQQHSPYASPSRKSCLPMVLRGTGMFGMVVLNPLCCVLAMNYASPSIVAPFSGLTLVWIVLFSGCVTHETPDAAQVAAACLIVVGEIMVGVFGDHTNDSDLQTAETVRHSYLALPFVLFCGASLVWFCGLFYSIYRSRSQSLQRFAWGVAGGSLTGFQNFLKDSLIVLKDDTPAVFPWTLFVALVICQIIASLGGLLILTACMKRYDATYSSAMFVGSFVIMTSIMSATHYDTFQHLHGDSVHLTMYPAGLLVLVVGVYRLANYVK